LLPLVYIVFSGVGYNCCTIYTAWTFSSGEWLAIIFTVP